MSDKRWWPNSSSRRERKERKWNFFWFSVNGENEGSEGGEGGDIGVGGDCRSRGGLGGSDRGSDTVVVLVYYRTILSRSSSCSTSFINNSNI